MVSAAPHQEGLQPWKNLKKGTSTLITVKHAGKQMCSMSRKADGVKSFSLREVAVSVGCHVRTSIEKAQRHPIPWTFWPMPWAISYRQLSWLSPWQLVAPCHQ